MDQRGRSGAARTGGAQRGRGGGGRGRLPRGGVGARGGWRALGHGRRAEQPGHPGRMAGRVRCRGRVRRAGPRLVAELGSAEDEVQSRLNLARDLWLAGGTGRERSRAELARALRDADELGWPEVTANAAYTAGHLARMEGDLDAARAQLARGRRDRGQARPARPARSADRQRARLPGGRRRATWRRREPATTARCGPRWERATGRSSPRCWPGWPIWRCAKATRCGPPRCWEPLRECVEPGTVRYRMSFEWRRQFAAR